MTTLTILPNYEKKRLKLIGAAAAGEHVSVTVVGGGAWTGEGKSLRLRVLHGAATVAKFPYWTAEDAENDTTDTIVADAWTTANSGEDAVCELVLNTVPAERQLRYGGETLWILDDAENHTLYGAGEFHVEPWPKERGEDVPYRLDEYPDIVAEIRTELDTHKAAVNSALAAQDAQITALDISKAAASDLASHTQDTLNPHSVTKAQVGLGNVNNTSDADKPVSAATAVAIIAAKSYAAGLADALNLRINTVVGGDEGKSARTIASEEVANIVANAPAAYDTLKEIADWIADDSDGAAALVNSLAALTARVNGITATGGAAAPNFVQAADLYATVKAQVGEDGGKRTEYRDGEIKVKPESGSLYTLMLPAAAGTLALTNQLPTVPTKTSNLTNDGDGTNAFLTQHQSLAGKQDALTAAQLANIAAVPDKANASDVYTKAQIDAKLPYKLGAGTIQNGHFYMDDRGGNVLTVAWVPHSFDPWDVASGTSISGSWVLNFDEIRNEWWLNIDGSDAGYVPNCDGDETSLTFTWSYYDDAGGETVSGETTFTRAATEYTQNVEDVIIPAPRTDGGLRDLILRLTIDETDKPGGETTALSFLPADANETLIFETRDGDFPAIEEGTWLWSFSETDTHKFALRREPLKVATQPTQGGGN